MIDCVVKGDAQLYAAIVVVSLF